MANDLDTFLQALKTQESGGNYQARNASGASGAYQFMPGTWANYKGYANAADAPPAVQDEKARQLAQSYFQKFGSWDAVAKAWYAGPGFATKNQTAPQGEYPSIQSYANQVMSKMGQPVTATGSVQTVTGQSIAQGTQKTPISGIDPSLPIEDQITALAYTQHGAALAAYIHDPEIRAVLRRYVMGEVDDETLSGLLMQTDVFRHTSLSQRQFDDLEATDPARAQANYQAKRASIEALAGTFGYQMKPEDIDFLARQSLRDGLTDLQVKNAIVGHFAMTGGGDAGAAYSTVNRLLGEWMAPVDEGTKQAWVTEFMMGRLSEETLSAHLRNVNAAQWPGMATALQANPNLTPLQYTAPPRQSISKLLEINPNDVDFTNPRYGQFLNYYDPQVKTYRALTAPEIEQRIKSDKTYGWDYTKNAMDSRVGFALNLAQAFGRRPGLT